MLILQGPSGCTFCLHFQLQQRYLYTVSITQHYFFQRKLSLTHTHTQTHRESKSKWWAPNNSCRPLEQEMFHHSHHTQICCHFIFPIRVSGIKLKWQITLLSQQRSPGAGESSQRVTLANGLLTIAKSHSLRSHLLPSLSHPRRCCNLHLSITIFTVCQHNVSPPFSRPCLSHSCEPYF